ncbi:hypothetical protein FRB94_011686 [Tulasnella sp. JGI-2019a]|nr:hypothetical protein FRB94_011686 [Tulasnella sp. JGI-2019a]
MESPEFKRSDLFSDVHYGHYMGQRLPGLRNTIPQAPLDLPDSSETVLNSAMVKPLKAVVQIPEAQLNRVVNNLLLASRFNLSMGGDASVLPYSSPDVFPDVDPAHDLPLQGPVVVASDDPQWFQEPIERIILPKLANSFHMGYHFTTQCALQTGTTTLIPNATDNDVNEALVNDQYLDGYEWRRVQVFRNESGMANWLYSNKNSVQEHAEATFVQYLDGERPISGGVMFSYITPQLVGFADLKDLSEARRAVLEGENRNIQGWIHAVREIGRVTSTRHFILYTGEYAILGIFDPLFDTIAFSPIERLDTSTSAADALPPPLVPIFQLITQAMVDAKLSKEDNELPVDMVTPHWSPDMPLNVLRFPYKDLASSAPRTLPVENIFYRALTLGIEVRQGLPVVRRDLAILVEAVVGEESGAGGNQQAETLVAGASPEEPLHAGTDDAYELDVEAPRVPNSAIAHASEPTDDLSSVEIPLASGSNGDRAAEPAQDAPSPPSPGPSERNDSVIASDPVYAPSFEHDDATVSNGPAIPDEDAGISGVEVEVEVSAVVLGKRRREEYEDPIASPSPVRSPRRALSPRLRKASPVVDDEDIMTSDDQEERPRPTKRVCVKAEETAQPEADPSNAQPEAGPSNATAAPIRRLREKAAVDYSGKANQDRAIKAMKTEKRVKIEAVLSLSTPEDPVFVRKDKDGKTRKKAKAPRKTAAKKVAVVEAQKKAKVAVEVEEKRVTRSGRASSADDTGLDRLPPAGTQKKEKGKGRNGSGPSKKK